MSTLVPLGNGFLFTFFSDTAKGQFIERNKGQIILTHQDLDHQGKYARWGKVEAVGSEVKGFKVGDIDLIEALQWTKGFDFEGMRFWKSDEEKVIALGDDESVTYTY